MISMAVFLLGLLIVSVMTGLVTEAFKALFDESGRPYRSNRMAGIVAIVVALGVSVAYLILSGTPFCAVTVVYIAALILLGWLCAMVGYDKVIQAISQLQAYKIATVDGTGTTSNEQSADPDTESDSDPPQEVNDNGN